MARRLELHAKLVAILGSQNVYFQPPENLVMKYPAIVYSVDSETAEFADNDPYSRTKRWAVTVIDQDPDSQIPDGVSAMRMSLFDRAYTASNLNHTRYNVYF